MNIASRLQALRKHMSEHKLDIYLIPSIDAHNSEYVPECWQRRPWISGFDGSAGEVMVTMEHAYLWTDGRYFLQADQQLDANHYSLMKQSGFAPETELWLASNGKNKRLGIDPRLVGIERANKLEKIMSSISGEMVVIENNLVDKAKLDLGESSDLPLAHAFHLGDKYTGVTLPERLQWLRNELNSSATDYIALNVLDEIAWLFNIRGADIDYNPLVISYALIGRNDATLFVDKEKISQELLAIFNTAGVKLAEYNSFGKALSELTGNIWLDEKTATYWMLKQATTNAKVKLTRSPIVAAKACKNSTEKDGARQAHIKDAAAVINFFVWLEKNWKNGVDEIAAANMLADFRSKQENLKGLSFSTISGFASNGAIIHYRATPETSKVINDSTLYLIDSGGQYLEGTTDITRTLHLGTPTEQQKRHYTLVLKGHLALARAVFPHGTCGEHLDILARQPLWNEYLNYRHGTGHGVGSFLCVHEGPQKISQALSGVPLIPGMIVSNEPGLYLDGEYGIRIENLCLINQLESESDYGPFYEFEDLTLVPYSRRLINLDLLDKVEIEQINNYYQQIKEKVRPNLGTEQQLWLDNEININ